MSEGKQFSHISVNAAEDDDVVIQAGAYKRSDPEPAAQVADGGYVQGVGADDPDFPVTEESDQREIPADEPSREASSTPDATRETYEQTLEDLEYSPMSHMQKYVLGGLACFVIVFVVYYVIRFVL